MGRWLNTGMWEAMGYQIKTGEKLEKERDLQVQTNEFPGLKHCHKIKQGHYINEELFRNTTVVSPKNTSLSCYSWLFMMSCSFTLQFGLLPLGSWEVWSATRLQASLVPGSTQRLRPPLSLRTSRLVIFLPEVCPTVWLIKLGAFAQMCGNKPDGHAEHRAVGMWVWTEMVEGRQAAGMMNCMPLNSVVWIRYREWKRPEKDETHIQYACGREAPC